MIPIEGHIFLDDSEIEESFIRASGPGGQNVNKVATAVQLRLDLSRSGSLPEEVRGRLARLAGRRVTRDGVLVITAQCHRTQERNRHDALERLVALIRRAVPPPTPRRPTRPTAAAKRRRLQFKAPNRAQRAKARHTLGDISSSGEADHRIFPAATRPNLMLGITKSVRPTPGDEAKTYLRLLLKLWSCAGIQAIDWWHPSRPRVILL